jgi:transcriptional regulator with XRE-family HTH domain
MKRTKLAAARAKKHWTLEQAAEQIGVDINTLYRWEKGRAKPRAYNIQKMCEVYEARASDLDLEDNETVTDVNTSQSNAEEEKENTQGFVGTDLTMRLLGLAFQAHPSFQHLQDKMTLIIEEYDAMQIDDDANISRRDALRRLATFPLITLNLNASHPVVQKHPEEILTQCAASLAACWELSKGKDEADLALAFNSASAYLPTLKTIVQNSPQHRQAAASLVGQCALLRTVMGWHLEGLKEAARYAQEAIKYSHEAKDVPLLLSTLDYLSWVYYYDTKQGKQALQTIESAIPLINQRDIVLPPRLLGGVFSTLALMQARNGQDGMTSLRRAAEAFFAPDIEEHRFVYMDYTTSDLVLNDGMVHYHQQEHDQALVSLAQLIDPTTLVLKMPLPERSRVEGLNVMALASLKSPQKDMERTLHFWTAGIQGAKALQSEQRFSEALLAYEIMEGIWSSERRIKNLRELTEHW